MSNPGKPSAKKMVFMIPLCVLLFAAGSASAATHYVSPTGSASWAASVNMGTPCSWSVAMQSAQAGDLVYFRAGTYNPGSAADYEHPAMYPSNSGTEENPITLQAYPGETVVLTGNSSGPTFGANGRNWIVWDGFKTSVVKFEPQGVNRAVTFVDSNHCTIRNCDITGLTITWHANNMCIGVYGSDSITIENCLLHGSFRSDLNEVNSTAIMSYSASNMVVRNCTIYNCVSGIFDKDAGRNNRFIYNYIYDCFNGIVIGNNQGGGYGENAEIYRNLILNCTNGISFYGANAPINNARVINNTIYKSGTQGTRGIDLAESDCHNLQVWNNIMENYRYGVRYFSGSDTVSYSDYNCWNRVSSWNMDSYSGADYSSLSSWQGATPFEDHSTTSDPAFVNEGSTTVEDYNLNAGSPCKNSGRNGEDMGAYPNGNDGVVIGYSSSGATTDTEPPSPPQNLRLVQ